MATQFPALGQQAPNVWRDQLKDYIDEGDSANVTNAQNVSAIWSGTQAQYDAITTKSSATLYVITEG